MNSTREECKVSKGTTSSRGTRTLLFSSIFVNVIHRDHRHNPVGILVTTKPTDETALVTVEIPKTQRRKVVRADEGITFIG